MAWFVRGGQMAVSRRLTALSLPALSILLLALVAAPALLLATPQPVHAQAGPVIDCTTNSAIFNTAYNGAGGKLSPGANDTNWDIGMGDSSGPGSVGGYSNAIVSGQLDVLWATSPFGNADWISLNSGGTQGGGPGGTVDIYFRYNFTLAPTVLPSSFGMHIDFYADNQIWEVYINGVPQSGVLPTVPQNAGNPYFHGGYLPGA